MSRSVRVDDEVKAELDRLRLPSERNYNGAVRRLLGPEGGSWQYCPGRVARCDLCGELREGVWTYWISAAISRHDVCDDCAEAVD